MGTIPTSNNKTLNIRLTNPIHADRAGLFMSMGKGIHVHRSLPSFELIVVRRGKLELYEEDNQFNLHAGQSLLLWPDCRHGGRKAYDPDLSFYWVHFTLPDKVQKTKKDSGREDLSFKVNQLSEPARPDYQRELLHRYLDERERGNIHPAQASLLLMQVLFESSRQAESTNISEHTNSLAGRIEAYIAAHCHQSLSTSDIAQAMGYNEDYLGRIFRNAYGLTITESIHRNQIKLAKSMLQSSRMNISEVADHCGFSNARYFRRIFQRCEGISPGAYRKMNSRIHINRY